MAPILDFFVLVNNEEELLQYCLESFALLSDMVGVVSVVDNNSTDLSLDIVRSFKDRLPIKLQRHYHNSNHGEMRTKALSVCTSPWIMYLDGDETFTKDMRDFFLSGRQEEADLWFFYKYTTFKDREHYVVGGNGHTQRLFRNGRGVHFPQSIHTEPIGDLPARKHCTDSEFLLFDHTACKSQEALWAKGQRYNWANREGVPAVGPQHEYVGRVANTKMENVARFNDNILGKIFTGPI